MKEASKKHNFFTTLPKDNEEEYLVVSHNKIVVNSSCHTTPAELEEGSYKFASGTDRGDCDTSIADTDILLRGALKILKYSSKGWVEIAQQLWNTEGKPSTSGNPNVSGDSDNQDETGEWSHTSTYLLLGLCLMSLLVILSTIFIVFLTWKNRNNHQQGQIRTPVAVQQRSSVNRVNIPLKPILNPARRSSTQHSSSSSSSSEDSE